MNNLDQIALDLRDKVLVAPRKGKRRVIALAGPPASGKSTIAECLARSLCKVGCMTQVVPMDGFHLDNDTLISRGLLHRKGAPETFDILGLLSLAAELADKVDVTFPVFDRARDISVAGADVIATETNTIIVEGNYLLMDAPIWRDLAQYWDMSIAIETKETTLRGRLIQRWETLGLTRPMAEARVDENDLQNARQIVELTTSADVWVSNS